MIRTKSFETNVALCCMIIALSPFINNYKTMILSKIFGIEITVYHIYVLYAILFTFYILIQLYVDAFLLHSTNVSYRSKYIISLHFIYYIVLSFPPILLSNILIVEIFFKKNLNKGLTFQNPMFIVFLIIQFILLYKTEWDMEFKKYKISFIVKDKILEEVNFSDRLIEKGKYYKAALIQYDIVRMYLKLITDNTIVDFEKSSLTNCCVKAYKKHKINYEQKDKFERTNKVWDDANSSEDKSDDDIDLIVLLRNHEYIKKELNEYFQIK